jgi:signal transduction histidine kinase
MPRSVHPPSSAQPTPEPHAQQVAPTNGAGCAAKNGDADGANALTNVLVVTHTDQGEILSLHWPESNDCQNCENLVGQSVASLFGPVAVEPYLARVQKVLTTQKPEEFKCVVRCGHHPISFEFLLSPLPNLRSSPLPLSSHFTDSVASDGVASDGTAVTRASVVGVGRRIVPEVAQLTEVRLTDSKGAIGNSYYALLSSVASNIRKTLDLNTIWQQTVSGLGNMLGLDRCLVCDYSKAMQTLTVVAEHYQPGLHPCLGKTFDLALKADFLNTLKSLEPVISDFERGSENGENDQPYTVLTVATCYQNEPNSILVLQQPPCRPWQPFEIELIQELTDQVGTAIAHAKLFNESRNIARELRKKSYALRQTNDELMRKHDELEEARQQAEEASRLKSDFLANTSHELRTPLNGMIGFLRLVLDDMADDDEERTEFIQESHNSAIHLLNLINDVLDIAKIEAGKMNLELSAVSLKEVLLEIEHSMRPHIEQRGLDFEILLPATLDEIKLYSSYQRLKQVLLNMISNAMKFTHEGGITVGVEITPKSIEYAGQSWPGLVKISVADTGIGVSLEKQDRLFQTFSQVDSARTRQYEGTGLGLAISQRLVEAMGGKVQFISMGEGLGSTVIFTSLLYQEPVMELSASSQMPDSLG